ncbi:MAG: hypothetical protein KJ740_23530 [Gammaproteobacteria bacterium]|nr:hypothetical protein [Gammaproteobacteria bacterium]
MAITTAAFESEICNFQHEVHQVLMGAVKSQDANAAKRIETMRGITTQDWQTAARAMLMARKTSVLEALSNNSLEAVAFGHVDVRESLFWAIGVADEHAAQRIVQEIAARRLNLDIDEHASALHSMETGLVHDALLEAYVTGANSRCV